MSGGESEIFVRQEDTDSGDDLPFFDDGRSSVTVTASFNRTFSRLDLSVRIDTYGLGGVPWKATVWFSEVLLRICSRNPTGFSNDDILELGCGVHAIPSLVALKLCRPHSVTCTDGVEDALAIVKENLSRNIQGEDDLWDRISVKLLPWGNEGAIRSVCDIRRPSLILGVELVYYQSLGAFHSLISTLDALWTDRTRFLLAYTARIPSVEQIFFDGMASAGFCFSIIEWMDDGESVCLEFRRCKALEEGVSTDEPARRPFSAMNSFEKTVKIS